VIIGVVIIVNRRLHSPRNTFWLGIIALNLLTIFMAVLRLLVVHVEGPQTPVNSTVYGGNEDGVICLTFSFMTGKPYTILLFILLLATLDRYVGIREIFKNSIWCTCHVGPSAFNSIQKSKNQNFMLNTTRIILVLSKVKPIIKITMNSEWKKSRC